MLIPFDHLWARHKIKVKDVLHVGANKGQEALDYMRRGVKRMVWIEAHEPTFQKLLKHLSNVGGLHTILRACISNKDGEIVNFNVANNDSQSSSILDLGTHSQEHPSVRYVDSVRMTTKRLDTLMKEENITFEYGSFLNIDLQGAELLALEGMGDILERFSHLYLEVNQRELYKGCALVGEVDTFLHERGFVGCETKMTNNGWGDKYYKRL